MNEPERPEIYALRMTLGTLGGIALTLIVVNCFMHSVLHLRPPWSALLSGIAGVGGSFLSRWVMTGRWR